LNIKEGGKKRMYVKVHEVCLDALPQRKRKT
jgi:hypothetical protein